MLLNDVKQCIKRRMNEHQGNAKDKDTNAEKNISMQKRAKLYVSRIYRFFQFEQAYLNLPHIIL